MAQINQKCRLDDLLVAKGLAPDRQKASAFVLAGQVIVNDQRVDKPGTIVSSDAVVRLRHKQFVSRGGDKLESALRHFDLHEHVKGSKVLDLGSSTGGFTDCSLQWGAELVWAVDVGTEQLHQNLRLNPRVKVLEKTDIRELEFDEGDLFDLVLADISFNSIERLWPHIKAIPQANSGLLLLLIKPQFELPAADVPKGGIVSDDQAIADLLLRTSQMFLRDGYEVCGVFECPVRGRSGNREYFHLLKPITLNSAKP